MKIPWRAYLELMRFPAVFTALADVAMGYLVTRGALHPPATFALLATVSALLYLAGMVLNDVFDAEADAQDRPQRPIPSGRVCRKRAAFVGWSLLVAGVLLAAHVSAHGADWRPAILAAGLAGCIVLYDAGAKRTALGPVAMGCCRMLNVLLGMSLAAEGRWPFDPRPWTTAEWAIAAGVGIYIAGVTWFARTEAHVTSRRQLLGGIAVMLAGLTALATSPRWGAPRSVRFFTEHDSWPLLWIALALVILGRFSVAATRPEPRRVQSAVRNALRALIVLDAAVVLGWVGPAWSCAVIALLAPMLLMERRFNTT